MKRRSLILLLGGASSGAMSVGTGAFSSVKAERGVEVSVASDGNAYLGLKRIDDGSKVVQITNKFTGTLDLTVTLKDSDGVISSVRVNGTELGEDGASEVTLGIGKDAHVAVECYEEGEDAEFTLMFDGEVVETGTTVEADRTFSITCDEDNATDEVVVQFPGNSGKAKIKSGIGGEITIQAYYEDDDGNVVSTEVEGVSEEEEISLNIDGGGQPPVIGVGIDGVGVFKKEDRGARQKVTEDHAVTGDDPFGTSK